MTVRKSFLVPALFGLYCFLVSILFFKFLTKGDQVAYTHFYETVSGYNLFTGFIYYNGILGAIEPVYYIIVFVFSHFVPKVLLFSVINGMFGYYLALLLLWRRTLWIVLIPLALNFYLFVLLFVAERLKVSLCFLLFAFAVASGRNQLFSSVAAALSHVQTVLLLVSIQLAKTAPGLKRILKGKINYKIIALFFLGFTILAGALVFRGYLMGKLSSYSSLGAARSMIKPTFFMLLTLIYARNAKLEAILLHLPLIMASFFVGDIRIVIFSYFIFFYYASAYRRGINWGMLVTSGYFMVKGVVFLIAILKYGTGF